MTTDILAPTEHELARTDAALLFPATTADAGPDALVGATPAPLTRTPEYDAPGADAWRCGTGHAFCVIPGALPLTCLQCAQRDGQALGCPNCGGAHQLARCEEFIAAIANPGAAVGRDWMKNRRHFLLTFGAWSHIEAETVAGAFADWCGYSDAAYWLRVWTDALTRTFDTA